MTRYRPPARWAQRREGKRPDLRGTWLDPKNRLKAKLQGGSHWRSFDYWTKIHWATPPWLTAEMLLEMADIYQSARAGIHEVGHIVPLKHPLVCGLNVPWNLQVIYRRENRNKSNNWWPDCPDHIDPDKNLPADMFGDVDPHQYKYQMRLEL